MSKALSVDLRVRVLSAVAAGATHREAAERFGVSAASASRWAARLRQEGHMAPKPSGGDHASHRVEAHAEPWCVDQGHGRNNPNPVRRQAMRT